MHFVSRIQDKKQDADIPLNEFGMIEPLIDSIPDGHILAIDFNYRQPEKNEHLLIARTETNKDGNPEIYAFIASEKMPIVFHNNSAIIRDKSISYGNPYVIDTISDGLVAHSINEVANSPYGNLYEPPQIGMRLVNMATDQIHDLDVQQSPLPDIMSRIVTIDQENGLSFQRWRHRAGQRDDVCQFAPSATPKLW